MELTKQEFSQRNVFKQSNFLVTAKYRMSELAINIFNALLTEISNEDMKFNEWKVSVKDLENKIGKRIDRNYLKKISKEIRHSEINIFSDTSESFIDINIATIFQYSEEKSEVLVVLNQALEPHLLNLKKSFAIGYLNEIVNIKGEYTKRLYMFFRQYAYAKEFTISLSKLKSILKTPDSMENYKVFKQRVLNVALKEVNSKTGLNIELKETRKGRKVDILTFYIEDNKTNKKDFSVQKNSNNITALADWYDSSEELIEAEVV